MQITEMKTELSNKTFSFQQQYKFYDFNNFYFFQFVILAVWITSALYSAPKFFWVNTITTTIGTKNETVCIANRKRFNSQLFDMINFVFLYVIPLAIMTVSINTESSLRQKYYYLVPTIKVYDEA